MKTLARAVALSLVVLLASCGSGNKGGGPVEPTDTVVLVYMIGSTLESSEEAFASVNLKEMMAAGQLDHTRVVVQTGGAKKSGTPPTDPRAMQPENVDWKRLQRYVVHPKSLEQVEDLGEESWIDPSLNMASSVAFLDFMDWAVGTYPARRYLVVLWDHGGGINLGIGRDENTKWALSMADIGMVLQTAVAGRKASIELVGFDACLMATAEVAAALVRGSKYMVASQDLEPGSGWDYTSFLRYVDGNPTSTGAEIGAEIVRGYVTKQVAEGNEDLTMSVVDLLSAASIVSALDGFARILTPYAEFQAGWNQIAKGRVRTLDWSTTPLMNSSLDLADLKGLATNVVAEIVANLGPDRLLEGQRDALLDAIAASVTTNAAHGTDAKATGLSIYFPSVLSAYATKGYAVNTAMGRDPFFAILYTNVQEGLLQTFYDFYLYNQAALKATISMTRDPSAPLSAIVQNDFDYALAAHRVPACTVRVSNRFVQAPCYDSFRIPDEVTRIPGGSTWLLNVSPASSWPALTSGSGIAQPVTLFPDTYGGKVRGTVNDYVVPVYYQRVVEGVREQMPGELAVREVIPANGDASSFEVTGFREDGSAPGKEFPIADGQTYVIRVYATVADVTGWFPTDREVTVSGGKLSLDFIALGAGQLGYFVIDLTGQVQESELVDYTPAR